MVGAVIKFASRASLFPSAWMSARKNCCANSPKSVKNSPKNIRAASSIVSRAQFWAIKHHQSTLIGIVDGRSESYARFRLSHLLTLAKLLHSNISESFVDEAEVKMRKRWKLEG